MTPLVLPAAVLDAVARGDSLPDDGHNVLRSGQRGKRLLLLRDLVHTAQAHQPGQVRRAGSVDAYTTVAEAQRRSRDAVDDVLMQPHVGAWVTRALHDLRTTGTVHDSALGQLGAVAAAAAVRAGLACEVTAYAAEGRIVLPTFGVVQVPRATRWIRITTDAGARTIGLTAGRQHWQVALDGTDGPGEPSWSALRHLRASHGGLAIDLQLDDLDPYRGCGHLVVTNSADDGVAVTWQRLLDAAWPMLVDDHRPVADAVSRHLTSVVPLAPSPEAPELSATCFEALGAVAMTQPRSPLNMALALAHEVQHTLLCSLLDLVPMVGGNTDERHYAPWRRDPRPLPGLLQGAHAWLGIAGFWEVRHRRALTRSSRETGTAAFELALARLQVARALDALARPEHVTAAGQRFVAAMRDRLAELHRAPVSTEADRMATTAAQDHWVAWRLRNICPDPDEITALADDWRDGRRVGPRPLAPSVMSDGGGPLASEARLDLIRRRFAGLWDPHSADDVSTDVDAADRALVAGQVDRAGSLYLGRLRDRPDDPSGWAGLAVARRHRTTPGGWALWHLPEVVCALHRVIARSGDAPDPDRLADWVGQLASPVDVA